MALPRYIERDPNAVATGYQPDAYVPGRLPSVAGADGQVLVDPAFSRARGQSEIDEAQNASARRRAEAQAIKEHAEGLGRRRTAEAQARIQGDPQAAAQYAGQQGAGLTADASANLQAGRVVSGKDPTYGPNKRFVETTLGTAQTPGLLNEQQDLQRQADAAQIAQERVAAEALTETANRQGMALEALRNNENAQARRQQEQIERIHRSNELAAKAADKFAESREIDPGRHWRNQNAFFKFMAVIGAGLLGWAGRTDSTAHITNAIAVDIEAQKAAIAKASQSVSDRRAQVGLEESLYGQILAQTGSEREADLIYTDALMSHAKSEMLAKLQNAGITTLNRAQELTFNALEQQHADIRRQREVFAATLTPTRSKFVPEIRDPLARKLEYEKGKLGLDMQRDAGKSNVDTLQKREAMQATSALERQKTDAAASGPPATAELRRQDESRHRLVQAVAPFRNEERLIEQIRTEYADNIPGFVFGLGFKKHLQTKDEVVAYERIKRAVIFKLRRESGANTPETEIEREAGAILSNANSEDAVNALLDDRLNEAKGWIDYYERGSDPAIVETVNNARAAPRAPIASGGVGEPDLFDTYGEQ